MANLYIVESPFQMLSALEARERFGGYSVLIHRLHPNPSVNAHARKLMEFGHWGQVFELGENCSMRGGRLRQYRLLIELKRRGLEWQRIFVGEVRSWAATRLVDLLNPPEVLVLDDGNATLAVHAEMAPEKGGRSSAIGRLVSPRAELLDKILGGLFRPFTNRGNDLYGHFTCFDLVPHCPEQQIVKHQFENLRRLTASKHTNEKEVLFFGGPLAEIGVLVLQEELAYLKQIRRYYAGHGQVVKYVPHRRESSNKLEQICGLGYVVERFDAPAEIAILGRQNLPARVASFYSTALYSVSRLVDLQGADAFLLEEQLIGARHRDEVRHVYDAYRQTMNVISRNELR